MHDPNLEQGYVDSTTDTRTATVFSTLGLPWRHPAIYITYDSENPKSSGGVAHFNFASNYNNTFRQLLAVYDAGDADTKLDAWIEEHRALHGTLMGELERLLWDALVVYGRRFLENYRYIVKFLKEECPEIAHTKGTPVYNDKGEIVAHEDIEFRQLPRKQAK